MGLGKLKFLLQDSADESQKGLESLAPEFDLEVLLLSGC